MAPHSLPLHSADPTQQRLYLENIDLKKALKEQIPGSNMRAEAAERSLFEMRQTLVSLAIGAIQHVPAEAWLVRTKVPTCAFLSTGKVTRSVCWPLVTSWM